MKNQAEDGRKKVKIPSCDHYALKIDFYPNYCVTITFLSGMGGSAKKLSLLAWSRCRADIFHLIFEILNIRQFACNYCNFSTKEVFMQATIMLKIRLFNTTIWSAEQQIATKCNNANITQPKGMGVNSTPGQIIVKQRRI